MQPITLANFILLVSAPLALANPVGEAASAIFDRQINCWKANCGGAGECAGSWCCVPWQAADGPACKCAPPGDTKYC
ncbi:hypothetical protein JMJ77_0003409 [Colletotrichum scovillei]|uniref:Uncharacterized protein n=2 Tax=Colletotrichum acutatum species complex TaxID=2707335 RepID=A0A9P7QTR8_9PEZI|nr:hypothetical protein JMJ78_0004915 [Colletotrichum scovillei]KAG7041302.1 hypothetical protein JMJ77_0003409 [Colletotrichum scovillei]KAG7061331.1 hypothetical protein JMJ76_0000896 [Colletotrichum scovillei]KXH59951.1 hypothetical protein CNYM01_09340 [Colletotrichum nymphaeae SA-01]